MARLHREVMRSVIERIARGDWSPGEMLPREQDLAARFGTSRGVARESIQALEDRGVVRVKHGRGSTIAPPAEWNLLDPVVLDGLLAAPGGRELRGEVLEARLAVEAEVGALAARRAGKEDVAALTGALERMARLGGSRRLLEDDAEELDAAERAFHGAVAAAAGNRLLGRTLAPLQGATPLSAASQLARTRAVEAYAEILDAVAARDEERTRTAIRELVESTAAGRERRARALTARPAPPPADPPVGRWRRGPPGGTLAAARPIPEEPAPMAHALTPAPFVVRDAVPLPAAGDALVATAERRDAYPIHVTRTLEELVAVLVGMLDGAPVAIVTDHEVEALYGGALVRALRAAGVEPLVRSIPPGEASKSLEQAAALWQWLAGSQVARRDVVLAFGGGVIADLGGWVASGYMRGLPYVNLPTTLLAQVDGALGGKVAVNHAVAKNLIGAFHQPAGVIANVGFLRTISGRHLRAGLAEAIKKAMIASPAYWSFIEGNAGAILDRDPEALERLVHCAAAIKSELVGRDPYEDDLRRPLNFGHTVGHPLETVTGYGPLLHGEAVALGMVVEARIAAARGLLDQATLGRLVALLRRCALPTTGAELAAPAGGRAVVAAMEKVRQIRAGSLRYVLPVAIGETVIADDVETAELEAALSACGIPVA